MTTTYPPTDTPKRKLVTVEVTQEDIDHGKPSNPWCCPVARAINRLDFEYAMVNTAWVYITVNYAARNRIEVRNPVRMVRWIRRYDKFPGEAKPARFRLPIGELVEG